MFRRKSKDKKPKQKIPVDKIPSQKIPKEKIPQQKSDYSVEHAEELYKVDLPPQKKKVDNKVTLSPIHKKSVPTVEDKHLKKKKRGKIKPKSNALKSPSQQNSGRISKTRSKTRKRPTTVRITNPSIINQTVPKKSKLPVEKPPHATEVLDRKRDNSSPPKSVVKEPTKSKLSSPHNSSQIPPKSTLTTKEPQFQSKSPSQIFSSSPRKQLDRVPKANKTKKISRLSKALKTARTGVEEQEPVTKQLNEIVEKQKIPTNKKPVHKIPKQKVPEEKIPKEE